MVSKTSFKRLKDPALVVNQLEGFVKKDTIDKKTFNTVDISTVITHESNVLGRVTKGVDTVSIYVDDEYIYVGFKYSSVAKVEKAMDIFSRNKLNKVIIDRIKIKDLKEVGADYYKYFTYFSDAKNAREVSVSGIDEKIVDIIVSKLVLEFKVKNINTLKGDKETGIQYDTKKFSKLDKFLSKNTNILFINGEVKLETITTFSFSELYAEITPDGFKIIHTKESDDTKSIQGIINVLINIE